MKRIGWFALLVLLGLGLAMPLACGDDDDDDNDAGDDDDDQNAFNPCEDTTTTLADLDAVSELLGVSAAEVVETTGGGFATTASYSEDTSVLTQTPLGGQTDLTVTIAYDGGEIRQIESTPVDTENEIAGECLHRIEIDVTIGFATADGAFSESWSGVLTQTVAAEGGLADPSLAAEFDPAAMSGGFAIVSFVGPEPDAVTAVLQSTAVEPVLGQVDILVEQSEGEGDDGTVSQTSHIALSWGGGE